MAENVYEGLFIFDANKYARDPAGVSGQIAALVEKLSGTVLASRLWEERRLAYPINGQRKGTYWLTYFRLDSAQLETMRRECQINETILRELTLKVEPRIVDALISHALAAAEAPKPRRAPAAAAAVPAIDTDVPEEADNEA